MGASPSIVATVYDTSEYHELGENTWLKMSISTDTTHAFHKLDVIARQDVGVSILDQEKDIVSVSGFKWDHVSIPMIEDEDTNCHETYRYAGGVKQKILSLCEDLGTCYPLQNTWR